VLVLVTDGGDTANTVTYAQALEQALRGEVMVYSIIDVPIEASAGRDTGGEHALITLAEQTGGKYFYANAGGLDKAFAQVSEDLAHAISARLLPAKQPPGVTFHRIHVYRSARGSEPLIFATAPAITRIRNLRTERDIESLLCAG
jgi:Ca-activated chloride channel family protein